MDLGRLRDPQMRAPFLFCLLAACAAPGDADRPVSDRVRAAPPPALAATATFELPRATGLADAAAGAAERDALAARAAALRARGAELSGADVVEPDARARLDQPAPDRP